LTQLPWWTSSSSARADHTQGRFAQLALWTLFGILSTGSTAFGQHPPGSLPRAEDVLPAGEVSRGSLVVAGEGYRFQVTPDYKPVDHQRSKLAYRATIQGLLAPGHLTLYATRRPFSGDLAALLARETGRITAKGGKLSWGSPVLIHIAGELKDAHRFYTIIDGVLDRHVLAVHRGHAYIFHGETPAVTNAWINMGADLMVRGSTFHVAPPQ
jgi:hypothetical protein